MKAVTHKRCPRCEKTKVADDFHKCRTRYDGLVTYCKECKKVIQRDNNVYHKEYVKRRYRNEEEYKQKVKDWNNKTRTRAKINAMGDVNYAIKTGKLIRGNCELCGKEKTDAHHEDYSKPLEVRWLCRSCHKRIHVGGLQLKKSN